MIHWLWLPVAFLTGAWAATMLLAVLVRADARKTAEDIEAGAKRIRDAYRV
jgi:hypothetical protein